MNKGFVFSMEAILALFFIATIASIHLEKPVSSFNELLVLQKENDLLKVWAKNGKFDLNEMKSDFEFVFPQKNGKISVNENEVSIGAGNGTAKKAISSDSFYFNSDLEKIDLRIIVFD